VQIAWKRPAAGGLTLDVTIPDNVSATVLLPITKPGSTSASGAGQPSFISETGAGHLYRRLGTVFLHRGKLASGFCDNFFDSSPPVPKSGACPTEMGSKESEMNDERQNELRCGCFRTRKDRPIMSRKSLAILISGSGLLVASAAHAQSDDMPPAEPAVPAEHRPSADPPIAPPTQPPFLRLR